MSQEIQMIELIEGQDTPPVAPGENVIFTEHGIPVCSFGLKAIQLAHAEGAFDETNTTLRKLEVSSPSVDLQLP